MSFCHGYSKSWDVCGVVHCDDFVFVGAREHPGKIASHVKGEFSLKVAVTGRGEHTALRVLNRSIRFTPRGIGYECDHRLADNLIEELGLRKCKVVVAPAIRESRRAKKNGENMEVPENSGGREDPRASAGQTGAARGEPHMVAEVRNHTHDKLPENAGGREDPGASAGPTGGGRGESRMMAPDEAAETKDHRNQDVVHTSGAGEDPPPPGSYMHRASRSWTGGGGGVSVRVSVR